MAVFKLSEADKYLSDGSNYFTLPDDGAKAVVRILYADPSDICMVDTHSVKWANGTRSIKCLKDDRSDPNDVCPLCASGSRISSRFFIPLYDYTDNRVKIWERGSTFRHKLANLCTHFPRLCDEIFEIERVGGRGDQNTTYDIICVTDEYPDNDEVFDFSMDDIDIPDVVNTECSQLLIRNKEQMEYYLENGRLEDDVVSDSDTRNSYNAQRNSYNSNRDAFARRTSQPRYSTRRTDSEDEIRPRRREY